jgi:transcriptional regulator with GAF, ATPase, and Fis domain
VTVSVLDQFRDAEQRVAQRLKELEPAVAEYRELEAVAKRLGIDGAATREVTPSRARGSGGRRASRTPAKRPASAVKSAAATPRGGRRARRAGASPGQREQQLLALVRERPGVTVAEAGKALGVDPTGLYRVVHRLEGRGELRKRGRALEPAAVRPE